VLAFAIELSDLRPCLFELGIEIIDLVKALAEQEFQPADEVLLMPQLGVQANVRGFERLALAFEWQDLV
jgi:hypothetical protein